jgi:hypothetical protein
MVPVHEPPFALRISPTDTGTYLYSTMSLSGTSEERFQPLDGKAAKTRVGYSAGRSAYLIFSKEQGNEKPLDEITEDDLTQNDGAKVKASLSKFANFLLMHKNESKKHYKADTQIQYLSNAKNFLADKYKHLELLKEGNDKNEWYIELLVRFDVLFVCLLKTSPSSSGSLSN